MSGWSLFVVFFFTYWTQDAYAFDKTKYANRLPASHVSLERPDPGRGRASGGGQGVTEAYASGQTIRLRGSLDAHYSGRVEVFLGGKWGLVCAHGWDMRDANVVCRQLGYTRGADEFYGNDSRNFIQDTPAGLTFAMTKVRCQGSETALHHCAHRTHGACKWRLDALVTCQPNPGCPKDWISGHGKCYMLSRRFRTISFARAQQRCAQENASLLTIESEAEGHFLSDILKTQLQVSERWLTAGKRVRGVWKWNKTEAESAKILTHSLLPMTIQKWISPESSHRNSSSRELCLVLSDFQMGNVVNYFYWNHSPCHGVLRLGFICQTQQDLSRPEDCYTGNGEDYRGSSQVSILNKRCIRWSHTRINKKTHPGQGLGNHNHCRNPDSDIRPWCWVGRDTLEYCLVPCEDKTKVTVQLVNGIWSGEGRVQVTFQGRSGTVCDDDFDDRDATVICRMLGHSNGGIAVLDGRFGSGQGQVWLDDVHCLGNESSIDQCESREWGHHDCHHFEDVGVRCLRPHMPTPTATSASAGMTGVTSNEELTVMLVGGTGRWEGRVEITKNGITGTVCDDEWDDDDAHVVCRMLGFRYGGAAIVDGRFGTGKGQVWLDDVHCVGNESSIDSCQHPPWGVHDCHHLEDASVVCNTTIDTTVAPTTAATMPSNKTTIPTPDILITNLVNGSSPYEGIVEVNVNGRAGGLCAQSWDDHEAEVVCRMLGRTFRQRLTGISVMDDRFRPMETGALWMVDCQGSESSLTDCSNGGWSTPAQCAYVYHAAAVFCYPPSDGTTPMPSTPATTAATAAAKTPTVSNAPNANPNTNKVVLPTCGKLPHAQRHTSSRIGGSFDWTRRTRSLDPLPGYSVQRIVGGTVSNAGEFPYQASISYTGSLAYSKHHCGAVVIGKHWLLTAAHCFYNRSRLRIPNQELTITVGNHDKLSWSPSEQRFRIADAILHRHYDHDQRTHDYDIALIRVDSDQGAGQGIEFNYFVQPACLPDKNATYSKDLACTISGWGDVRKQKGRLTYAVVSFALRHANVNFISWNACKNMYEASPFNQVTERMVCANNSKGGVDACYGDSGGPLACKLGDSYTVFGLVSWGKGCGQKEYPGVYTKVSYFHDWISDVIKVKSRTDEQKVMPRRPAT